MSDKVRVMVVDDTITYRQILSNVVKILPNAELVGTASSGKTALMKIKSLKPDLVFLDVMMPEMDGIETLQHMKEVNPTVQVVMVSGFDMANAKATLDSLENGALDFVAKPKARDMQDGIEQLKHSLEPLVEVVMQKMGKSGTPVQPVIPSPAPRHPVSSVVGTGQKDGKYDLVLIGISTGGPNALQKLFESIEGELDCPVLIVQHMPPMFTRSLADRLSSLSSMDIVEAEDNQSAQSGKVYIAPGGKHMVLREKAGGDYQIKIIDSPPVNHCKPAVDVLFRSVAAFRNINMLCVIMTGMGRDGTAGVRAVKRKGNYCIIQDESSSVVWGMPGSVYGESLADEVLPLDKLGQRIVELTAK